MDITSNVHSQPPDWRRTAFQRIDRQGMTLRQVKRIARNSVFWRYYSIKLTMTIRLKNFVCPTPGQRINKNFSFVWVKSENILTDIEWAFLTPSFAKNLPETFKGIESQVQVNTLFHSCTSRHVVYGEGKDRLCWWVTAGHHLIEITLTKFCAHTCTILDFKPGPI